MDKGFTFMADLTMGKQRTEKLYCEVTPIQV